MPCVISGGAFPLLGFRGLRFWLSGSLRGSIGIRLRGKQTVAPEKLLQTCDASLIAHQQREEHDEQTNGPALAQNSMQECFHLLTLLCRLPPGPGWLASPTR